MTLTPEMLNKLLSNTRTGQIVHAAREREQKNRPSNGNDVTPEDKALYIALFMIELTEAFSTHPGFEGIKSSFDRILRLIGKTFLEEENGKNLISLMLDAMYEDKKDFKAGRIEF